MRARTARRLAGHFPRMPGSLHPFRRIAILMKAYNAAALAKDQVALILAQAAVIAYKSNGHGHKPTMSRKIGGAWSLDRSRYMPNACQAMGRA